MRNQGTVFALLYFTACAFDLLLDFSAAGVLSFAGEALSVAFSDAFEADFFDASDLADVFAAFALRSLVAASLLELDSVSALRFGGIV